MSNAFKLFDFMKTPVYLRYWFFAILLFVGFDISLFISIFISVLVHELAHTYVAKKLNYHVSSVALDVFYGSAQVDSSYQYRHKHSLLIVGAGPLSNLLLFGICFIALLYFPDNKFIMDLSFVNILLFVFNILPIYPMDGGRISKSLICLALDKMGIVKANKKGKMYNGVLSLFTSVALMIFCINAKMFILALFSIAFIYFSYLEITNKNHF